MTFVTTLRCRLRFSQWAGAPHSVGIGQRPGVLVTVVPPGSQNRPRACGSAPDSAVQGLGALVTCASGTHTGAALRETELRGGCLWDTRCPGPTSGAGGTTDVRERSGQLKAQARRTLMRAHGLQRALSKLPLWTFGGGRTRGSEKAFGTVLFFLPHVGHEVGFS